MTTVMQRSLGDIFTPQVLSFILKVGMGSILFWITTLWLSWDLYAGVISTYIETIPFIGSWEWFQSSGALLTALIVGYMLIIITISTLTTLLSEPLLIKLAKRHYPDVAVTGSPGITISTLLSLKAVVLFLLIFLITFPLIFIPIFGQVWMLWLWSILIKEPGTYEITALFISDKNQAKKSIKQSTITAMTASLFNYIPLLNIFAPLFSQILFLHHVLGKGK